MLLDKIAWKRIKGKVYDKANSILLKEHYGKYTDHLCHKLDNIFYKSNFLSLNFPTI